MTPRIVAIALMAALLLPMSASASPQTSVYAFTRGAFSGPSDSELLAPVVVPEGADLFLFNTQPWGHSMYSDLNGKDDRLFWSEVVPFGESTLVHGVSSLPPGRYAFHCSNHPPMKGTLTVIDKEEL